MLSKSTQKQLLLKKFAEALDTQVATTSDILKIESELKVIKWIGGVIVAVEVIPILKSVFGL